MTRKRNIDILFLILSLILVVFGLIMVYSSSFVEAMEKYEDASFFLRKQIIWAVAGLVAMFIVSGIDYHFFIKNSMKFLLLFGALLVVLLFLPESFQVKGANRWISLKFFKIQPSEFVKYIFIWYLSYYFGKTENITGIEKKIWKPLFIFTVIALMILLQPDLGTVFVIGFSFFTVLFILGLRYSYLTGLFFGGILSFIGAVAIEPYRRNRIFAFLNPWEYRYSYGYHIINSLMAVGSGGLFGLGLGQSRQKHLYLPEPYNDFIFAIICEELGFAGALFVIFLFLLMFLRGWHIIKRAPDISGFILGIGILITIVNQALINIGVVLNLFPTKGLPLPFISYGGSSLLMLFINVGIILNISRNRNENSEE